MAIDEIRTECLPGLTSLLPDEQVWADHQPYLEARGFMLRPRYRPGWVPEAIRLGKSVFQCEDSIALSEGVGFFTSFHSLCSDFTGLGSRCHAHIRRRTNGPENR